MNAVKEFVVPAAVLTVICLVVSAVLAGTYQVTEPVIEAAKRAEADASRVVVLPSGKNFEEVSIGGLKNIVDAYVAGNGEGYVITGTAKGYGGDLQVMAGIDKNGKIAGVKLMDNNETQGIGSKTGEDAYTSQYIGKDSSLDGVTAISGASISSKAFESAVGSIYTAYDALVSGNVPAAAPAGAGDGFTGTAQGFGGDVTVTLTIENDKIASITIDTPNETAGFGAKASEAEYTDTWIGLGEGETPDAISGATITSDAVKAAVAEAFAAYNASKGA